MRNRLCCLLACLLGMLAPVALAQNGGRNVPIGPNTPAADAPGPPEAAAPLIPPPADQAAEGEWVPDGVAVLGRGATSHVEFRLDHSMLALASKMDSGNQEFRRAIAGLNGISFRTFRFPDGAWPDAAAMELIGRQYQDAGWMHVMSKHANPERGTDLWVRVEALAVREVAVLVVRPRQVEFIAASGTMSPLELLHLSGHFGIPRMDQPVSPPPRDYR